MLVQVRPGYVILYRLVEVRPVKARLVQVRP